MHKSILVAVDSFHWVSKYKVMRKTTSKLMAHDETNECNIGDRVKITHCRPLSRRKAFMLTEILQREKIYNVKEVKAEQARQKAAAEAEAAEAAADAAQEATAEGIQPPTAPVPGINRGFAASAIE